MATKIKIKMDDIGKILLKRALRKVVFNIG